MIVKVAILKEIAGVEFSDIVVEVLTDLNTMRIIFLDESYCDMTNQPSNFPTPGSFRSSISKNPETVTSKRQDNRSIICPMRLAK